MLRKSIYKADQLLKEIRFFESGNQEYLYNFVDGKLSGLYQKYSEEGVMIEEGYYKNGYQDGIWKAFDEDDERLLSETTFVDDAMNGVYKKYNEANRVGTLGFYKNNEQDGMWKYYNLAEKLIKEVEYKLGREISSKEYK